MQHTKFVIYIQIIWTLLGFSVVAFAESTPYPPAEYAGHIVDDETGLIYAKARYLDPTVGTFITSDPLFSSSPLQCVDSPSECQLYSYAGNNPTNFVDPSGLTKKQVSKRSKKRRSARLAATNPNNNQIAPLPARVSADRPTKLAQLVRAQHLNSLRGSQAEGRSTAAIGLFRRNDGSYLNVVTVNGKGPPGLRQRWSMWRSGETFHQSPGHAEISLLDYADAHNSLTLVRISVSRPICDNCRAAINNRQPNAELNDGRNPN